MHSVDRDSVPLTRDETRANPVSTRVCTPRYYDTQQAGVYSTPSKNTLGARRRARPGVLRVARGRLRRSCRFQKITRFPLAAPRYWPRERSGLRPHRGTNPDAAPAPL